MKRTLVTVSSLFGNESSRAPKGTRIEITPEGFQTQVTAVVKKKNCTTARIEFPDPTRSNQPTRINIPLNMVVTSLG